MYIKNILFVIAVVSLLPAHVLAKNVTVCNASPIEIDLSVVVEPNLGTKISKGWYNQKPGDCNSWNTQGKYFYYYAESGEQLARWLNEGKKYKWKGLSRNCINSYDAFEYYAKANCSTKAFFKTTLLKYDSSMVYIYEKNHKKMSLSDAKFVRQDLLGVMNFESVLKSSPGKESHFSLGIDMSDKQGYVRIEKVYPGMPAKFEQLKVGDIISVLNGYRIDNSEDVIWVLRNIDLFRNEPISMTIIRNGESLSGQIAPLFFPFNHPEYREAGKAQTFLWSMYDGVFLGFGNEVTCGGVYALGEGLNALSQKKDYDTQKAMKNASKCSKSNNRELAKKRLLYADSANAGMWASVIVPGIPIAKMVRTGRLAPLASRSRFIAQRLIRKSLRNSLKGS